MLQVQAQPYTPSFFDLHKAGSLSSARAVLGDLFTILGDPPTGVADIGCGLGTWLRAALELGAKVVHGFDGDWVPKERLEIPIESFTSCDLVRLSMGRPSAELDSLGRVDLAISVEVAEHLPPDCACGFVELLCSKSDLILFSAAIPFQGGTDHVNENWPSVWSTLFARQGYECFDILRDRVWLRADVEWWYSQNVLVFATGEANTRLRSRSSPVAEPLPLIHPRKYLLQVAAEQELRQALVAATAAAFPGVVALPPQLLALERKVAMLRAALERGHDVDSDPHREASILEVTSLYDKVRLYAHRLGEELAAAHSQSSYLKNQLNKELQSREVRDAGTIGELEKRLQIALDDAAEARRVSIAMARSKSWTITSPFRAAAKIGRRLLGRH
jgi:hypothetical protein